MHNTCKEGIKSNQIYLLKTHHISLQQVVKAVDEQGQRGPKEHLPLVTLFINCFYHLLHLNVIYYIK